jgi:hypothetical protein
VEDLSAAAGVQLPPDRNISGPEPPNTGTLPSVWKFSHAMPCGSCSQVLSDVA